MFLYWANQHSLFAVADVQPQTATLRTGAVGVVDVTPESVRQTRDGDGKDVPRKPEPVKTCKCGGVVQCCHRRRQRHGVRRRRRTFTVDLCTEENVVPAIFIRLFTEQFCTSVVIAQNVIKNSTIFKAILIGLLPEIISS